MQVFWGRLASQRTAAKAKHREEPVSAVSDTGGKEEEREGEARTEVS